MLRPILRPNRNVRLSDDEVDLLRHAAFAEGFTSWSAWARHVLVPLARELCERHGYVQKRPDDGPTLWEKSTPTEG